VEGSRSLGFAWDDNANMFNAIVLHFDEIILKGDNRKMFEDKMIQNIKNCCNVYVTKASGKFIVDLQIPRQARDDKVDGLIEKLRFLPGISNLAPAIVCAPDLEEIKKSALKIAQHYFVQTCRRRVSTFKIETSRSDKKFSLKSPEISKAVGGYVLENFKGELKVDVHEPILEIKVEVDKDKAAVLGEKVHGVGGLPVGTTGTVVALLSGGIDSPVAAFSMMKRGAKVVFVHFHNQTVDKTGVEQKIKDLAKELSKAQGETVLYIVPFADLQKEVIANVPADYRMIVYRRIMFQIAEMIAEKERAGALVTGDSLGQVASQTMENLRAIYHVTDMLKFSPLIGMNKQEIVDLAQEIGTYEISIQPHDDCCSFMIADHPKTKAKLREVVDLEKGIDKNLFAQAEEKSERIVI